LSILAGGLGSWILHYSSRPCLKQDSSSPCVLVGVTNGKNGKWFWRYKMEMIKHAGGAHSFCLLLVTKTKIINILLLKLKQVEVEASILKGRVLAG